VFLPNWWLDEFFFFFTMKKNKNKQTKKTVHPSIFYGIKAKKITPRIDSGRGGLLSPFIQGFLLSFRLLFVCFTPFNPQLQIFTAM